MNEEIGPRNTRNKRKEGTSYASRRVPGSPRDSRGVFGDLPKTLLIGPRSGDFGSLRRVASKCTRVACAPLFLLGLIVLLAGCAGDRHHHLVISATDQKMALLRDGQLLAIYPVSTSKFGLGSTPNSHATPVGELKVKKKIGTGAPSGAVFKSRIATGEVLEVDAPGRDPIVTRILWLDGREHDNRNAFERYIYIHGTPEERTIGTPTSYGCIRMRSRDVIEVFDTVGEGARVSILAGPLAAPGN